MANEFIRLSGISKSFSGVQALREVDLVLEKGRIHTLVGENGCGKSTLIKILAGVYPRDAGKVFVDGREIDEIRPIDAILAGIQVIYQDFSLFPNLTVAENIALTEEVADRRRIVRWRNVTQVAKQALAQIDVDLPLNMLVGDLSVANKQLIAIARAMRQNARLIVMDEPTSALTEREIRILFSVIHKLQAKGITFLFVSHKLNEVLEISETIIVMRNGRNVSSGPVAEYDQARLIYDMTGQVIREKAYAFTSDVNIAPLLRVEKLNAANTLYDISFDLHKGEILGITGLLGSGRTELALALFGMLPVESGTFQMDGKPVRIRSTGDAIALGIGYVPEDRLTQGLFLEQSIGKNIIVRTIRDLKGPLGLTKQGLVNSEIDEWVGKMRIKTPSPDLAAKTLSGGNQQRVVVGKWLASEPRLMILNGPTMGVDVGSKNELHDLIKQLAQDGMGILLISDDIPELLQTCNRILLMRHGRIEDEMQASQTNENELAAKLIEE